MVNLSLLVFRVLLWILLWSALMKIMLICCFNQGTCSLWTCLFQQVMGLCLWGDWSLPGEHWSETVSPFSFHSKRNIVAYVTGWLFRRIVWVLEGGVCPLTQVSISFTTISVCLVKELQNVVFILVAKVRLVPASWLYDCFIRPILSRYWHVKIGWYSSFQEFQLS